MSENELLNELTDLIKLYRQQKRLTLKILSEKTHLSSKYLNSLELGKHNPSISKYLSIIKALEIPSEDLCKIISSYLHD